jgi:hypothetical protein
MVNGIFWFFCSQSIFIKFPRGSPSYQGLPQYVPNATKVSPFFTYVAMPRGRPSIFQQFFLF